VWQVVSFDATKGAADDPDCKWPDGSAAGGEANARCGHRYANHGEKGCKFLHARGMLCPCKAFRKGK